MVSSAGACERNWSTYDFIHCKKRNRLTPQRANDLVFVFTNLRLMAKFKEPEKFVEWVSEYDEEQQEAMLHLHSDEELLIEHPADQEDVEQDEEMLGSP